MKRGFFFRKKETTVVEKTTIEKFRRNFKMNRQGFFLAEETLKIVIAVICVGVLVYLLASVYFNNQNEKDLGLAKASLENLVEQINVRSSETQIYNPGGWSILSFPYENGKPLSCSNVEWSSCICICKGSWFGSNLDNCDDMGTCLENSQGFMIANSIEIKNPPITLNIDKENKKITLK